ncbi:MAG: NADP-dependent oxidoreductase [Acidimicrobiales bacterium]
MSEQNRQMVLAQRPRGMVDDTTVRLQEAPVPEPGPGQALVRVRWLSIDPTIRTWMDDRPGYLPPIGIGDVIRGGGIGEVVSSRNDDYKPGDLVFGMTGWQDYTLVGDGEHAMQVVPPGIEPPAVLNIFGVNGMTAYFGLLDVGRMQQGDTVVVSGAAGATGSLVGQIARIHGAGRVVGIAGTPEKCAWLVDELGFDAAIDYRKDDVAAELRRHCPEGIDLYFDNVGGEILEICLAQLAMRGRVVLCGAISMYNATELPPGPRTLTNLIVKRGRMEGFLVLDYVERFPAAQLDMAGWLGEGKIRHAEHVVKGLEHAPDALNVLFTGGNIGKVVVEL